MQSYAGCGSQFRIDVIPFQVGGVIARLRPFLSSVLIRPDSALLVFMISSGIGHLARHGHHHDVVQVAAARSAEVSMGESDDGRVAPIVA